jgi:hypothetical protein
VHESVSNAVSDDCQRLALNRWLREIRILDHTLSALQEGTAKLLTERFEQSPETNYCYRRIGFAASLGVELREHGTLRGAVDAVELKQNFDLLALEWEVRGPDDRVRIPPIDCRTSCGMDYQLTKHLSQAKLSERQGHDEPSSTVLRFR